MSGQAIDELKQVLGPGGWLEAADMDPYENDQRGTYHGTALLVARPKTTEDVAEVVKICRRHGIAIVTQGGNTGLVGGSVPVGGRPSVIVSLARMNRILSVDPERYAITAEAGCILQTIHDAAEQVDRQFAMDWGARGSAHVGGGISTNAGGINVLRFGTARDQVLGLEVVLPDGRIWDGLRTLRKDSSGYDLKHLFIGAEGTLGIVTKAVVKLHPRPTHNQSIFAALADFDRLMELFVLARDVSGGDLSAFELIPGEGVELAVGKEPALARPIEQVAEWMVLVRFSGRDDVEDKLMRFFERALEAGLVSDGVISQSLAQEENLWMLRDEILPTRLFTGKMLKWDASVPIDRVVPFLKEARALADEVAPGTRVYAFGHVGDGNLHTTMWPQGTPGEAAFDAACAKLVAGVDALVWRHGGSICAEHGVGQENIARLTGQKPAVELEMMARLRTLFDPDGLFNPGKLVDRALADRAAAE